MQRYYFDGNVMPGYFDESNQEDGRSIQGSVDYETYVDEPFFESLVTTQSAGDAFKNVLSDIGCTQPVFDDHDIRVVNETLEGTYSCNGRVTHLPGLPDHEQDVGGWEEYPGFVRTANWDTDMDGLPNWWEAAHDLDTNSVSGSLLETNADNDLNGYTNLEEYLQWMSKPHYFIGVGEDKKIDLSIYTRGFSNDPKFEISEIINGDASVEEDTSFVNFTPLSEGMAEFKFTVTDAEGSSMTQKMGLYIGEITTDTMFSYSYYKDRDKTEIVYIGNQPQSVSQLEEKSKNINLYPNPAHEMINISFNSELSTSAEFSITDIAGRKLSMTKAEIFPHSNQLSINVAKLSAGIYILKISSPEFDKTVSFIKN